MLSAVLFFSSCKKDPVTNALITRQIKKVTSTSSDSKIKSVTTYLFDNNNRLSATIFTETDTTTGFSVTDTIRVLNFYYTNNLPSNVTIATNKYDRSGGVVNVLTNTFNRHYSFDAQDRILLDSLASYNLQYNYTSYKDTIGYLTDRAITYTGNTQNTTFYNSHLLSNNFIWVYDTAVFTNGNLTNESNTSYITNKYISFSKTATFSNYDNPLFIGLIPQFGQSQKLPLNETYIYNGYNIPVTYQYNVDANGNVLMSIENTFNTSTGAGKIVTSYYEYY